MTNNKILMVESVPVTIIKQSDADFISLTDMVRQSESGSAVIDNWLRNKNTLEFLSVREEIYNPAFNSLEFEEIKKVAGLNRFTMSVKQWISSTHAIAMDRHGLRPRDDGEALSLRAQRGNPRRWFIHDGSPRPVASR